LVTCESCHGPGMTMELDTSSTLCAKCHSNPHFPTYQEWLESEHGKHGVACVDCHDLPDLTLRAETTTELCNWCHAERVEEYKEGTHGDNKVQCTNCHMSMRPFDPSVGEPAVTGHTYKPTAEACASCHSSGDIHTRDDISGLTEINTELQNNVTQLQVQITELEEYVNRANLTYRYQLYGGVVVVAIIAISTIWFYSRSRTAG
jgi:formate-dependent nitrite reductase cytochrome c552 subunit